MICLLQNGKLTRDVPLLMLGTPQDILHTVLENGRTMLATELEISTNEVAVSVDLHNDRMVPRWRVPKRLSPEIVRAAVNRVSYMIDAMWRTYRHDMAQRRP